MKKHKIRVVTLFTKPSKTPVSCDKYHNNLYVLISNHAKYLKRFLQLVNSFWVVSFCHKLNQ